MSDDVPETVQTWAIAAVLDDLMIHRQLTFKGWTHAIWCLMNSADFPDQQSFIKGMNLRIGDDEPRSEAPL